MRKTHHTGGTLYTRNYSGMKSSMRRERNRGTGELTAGLAFPVMANLAALDKLTARDLAGAQLCYHPAVSR